MLRDALLVTLSRPAVPLVAFARAVVVLVNRGSALLVAFKKAFCFELRATPLLELDTAMLVTLGSESILVGRGVRDTLLLRGEVAPVMGDDSDDVPMPELSFGVSERLVLMLVLVLELFAGGRRDRLAGSVRLPDTVELVNLALVEFPNMVKLCMGGTVRTTVAVAVS
jgi:hypothetical protein